jgi:hypothetical protein
VQIGFVRIDQLLQTFWVQMPAFRPNLKRNTGIHAGSKSYGLIRQSQRLPSTSVLPR